MLPLSGLGVLVTRPETQAIALCRQLEAQGAVTVRLPAIRILAQELRGEQGDPGLEEQRYDLIIFVSANAVRYGAAQLGAHRDLTLAAVGPATLRALHQAGLRVAILPDGSFDTEGLLAHPRLQNLTGQRVLIIKGEGGRELLETALTQRGAAVSSLSVYRREAATLSADGAAALVQDFNAGSLQVVTATSAEIGFSLLAMGAAHPDLLSCLQRCHWLIPGARVAEALQVRGLSAPCLLAASAEDQALVEALVRWRASASGA